MPASELGVELRVFRMVSLHLSKKFQIGKLALTQAYFPKSIWTRDHVAECDLLLSECQSPCSSDLPPVVKDGLADEDAEGEDEEPVAGGFTAGDGFDAFFESVVFQEAFFGGDE